MPNDIHQIPAVRMDQSMAVAANMVAALIGTFGRPGDTEDELSTLHLMCLAVFLAQLLSGAKHKDKVASILEALVVELRNAQ